MANEKIETLEADVATARAALEAAATTKAQHEADARAAEDAGDYPAFERAHAALGRATFEHRRAVNVLAAAETALARHVAATLVREYDAAASEASSTHVAAQVLALVPRLVELADLVKDIDEELVAITDAQRDACARAEAIAARARAAGSPLTDECGRPVPRIDPMRYGTVRDLARVALCLAGASPEGASAHLIMPIAEPDVGAPEHYEYSLVRAALEHAEQETER